jgi:hypothetical protein
VGITVNASAATSQGIDFSGHLKVTPRLSIAAPIPTPTRT